MNKPLHQRIITLVIYLGTGFFALAAFLDAINNTLSVVTPQLSVIGTIFIALFWVVLEIILRKWHLSWITDTGGVVKISSLGIKPRLAILGAALLLWVPRIINNDISTLVWSNSIRPADTNEILIIVANYRNESRQHNYDLAGSIELAVRDGLSKCTESTLLMHRIRLEGIDQSFSRTQYEVIKTLGDSLNATLVIWGYYDDGGIFPYFTVIPDQVRNAPNTFSTSSLYSGPLPPNLDNSISPDSRIGFYVHREVPQLMTFLTQATLAQYLFLAGDGCGALSYAENAIAASQGITVHEIGKSLEAAYAIKAANYYIGINLRLGEDAYNEAVSAFSEAIKLNPALSYYFPRAKLYLAHKEYEDAIDDLTTIIELESREERAGDTTATENVFFGIVPKLEEVYFLRGRAYETTDRPIQAIEDFNYAITLDPAYVDAYYRRGETYLAQSDFTNAAADLVRVIQLDPNFTQAYFSLGEAYVSLGTADLDRAIENNPQDAKAHFIRGLSYHAKSEYENAILEFDAVIRLEPQYAYAYYFQGLCYSHQNNLDAAIGSYSEAIQLVPDQGDFYFDRGIDYFGKGNFEAAVADLTQAIQYGTSYPKMYSYWNRASAYYAMGEKAKSLDDYRNALAEFQGPDELRKQMEQEIESLELEVKP